VKKNIFLSVIIFFTFLLSGKASAQDTLQSKFGVFFGLANNVHSADFSALPGIPAALGSYGAGYGNGFAFSLLYNYPLNDLLFIDGRFGYIDHSVILFAANGQANVFVNGTKTTASVTRSIELVAGSYGLEARLGVHVIKGLIISAGIRMGFLSSPKFIQKDSASQGTFADSNGIDTKRGMRNQYAGDLPGATSILFHGILSIGYEFPINRKHTTFIVPEITYTPALNDIVKGITWKTDAVVYGISLKFSF